MLGRSQKRKMQQSKVNNKLDNFCTLLENLSSQMANSFTLGNYGIIETIDIKNVINTSLIGVFLNPIICLLEDLVIQYSHQKQQNFLIPLFRLGIVKDSLAHLL